VLTDRDRVVHEHAEAEIRSPGLYLL